MQTLRVFYVLAVLTGVALCVVWQGMQTRHTGRRIEQIEREVESIRGDHGRYRAEIQRLRRPQRIIAGAQELGLAQPVPGEGARTWNAETDLSAATRTTR